MQCVTGVQAGEPQRVRSDDEAREPARTDAEATRLEEEWPLPACATRTTVPKGSRTPSSAEPFPCGRAPSTAICNRRLPDPASTLTLPLIVTAAPPMSRTLTLTVRAPGVA